MFFKGTKHKAQPKILRIQVDIDLYAYTQFLRSGSETIPISKNFDDVANNYHYEIQVLPSVNGDWYFHKTAGEFAHTLTAFIELDNYIGSGLNSELTKKYGADLEISWWNEMLHICLGRRSIALVPVHEAGSIARTGFTSESSFRNTITGTEEIPIAFDSAFKKDRKPTKTELINKRIGRNGAMYWNDVCCVTFDSPTAGVVVRSNG